MQDWCKWLSLSLEICSCAEETVEVMHTLAILLNYFGHCEGVLAMFDQYCHFTITTTSTHAVLLAEGVLLSSLLQCGQGQNDKDICKILVEHYEELDENQFCFGSIIGFYQARSQENDLIGDVIRSFPNHENIVKNMANLAKEYDERSFRNVSVPLFIVFHRSYRNKVKWQFHDTMFQCFSFSEARAGGHGRQGYIL